MNERPPSPCPCGSEECAEQYKQDKDKFDKLFTFGNIIAYGPLHKAIEEKKKKTFKKE
jgi:hypothetical protein